jgi:hypothetical protein
MGAVVQLSLGAEPAAIGFRRCGASGRRLVSKPRKYPELRGMCLPCAHVFHGRAYNKRPGAVRRALRHNMNRLYGISLDQFDALRHAQDYRCAICHTHEDVLQSVTHKGQPGRLSVDHDHHTGRIRKLLCRSCNVMLGQARDSPAVLRAGAAYLDSFQ